MIFAGLYAWQSFKNGVPNFVALLWPALFLSLGWNFLEFGLDPPGGEGLAWGWLVCAILFGLMGGLPLLFVVPYLARRFTRDQPAQPWRAVMPKPGNMRAAAAVLSALRKAPVPTAPPQESTDVVTLLERLDSLRRSGALDEQEYEAAKEKILGTEGT